MFRFRAYLIILMMVVCLIIQGCGTLKKLDGSTEEELEKFKMTKDQIWDELQKLKVTNQRLQNRVDTLNREIEKSDKLEGMVQALSKEIDTEKKDKLALEKKLSGVEQEKKTLENRISEIEQKKAVETLKIKVLSGDGEIGSAKQMADRLRNMGYRIKRIDLAAKPAFKRHTIFFAPDFKTEAEHLVSRLGGTSSLKPLTWSSKFDLIVVTGKNP